MAIPLSVSLFFFTLFFYLRSLCATFNINDSGETIVDCDRLSLAHSPGYPLHTLLGRLFCLLPMGQPMFRLTFGSAVMGAAAVALAYLILRRILQPPAAETATENPPRGFLPEVPALFGALAFAFSYQHWFQAGGGKGSIYTLNTLLAVSTVLTLLKMREPGWFKRGFALFVFLLGLALSVHWETQAVLLPAYAWLLFSAQNRVRLLEIARNLLRPFDLAGALVRLGGAFAGKAGWLRAAALLCLPLSSYLFLPIRSSLNPDINWWAPQTLGRFLTVVTRGNYTSISGAVSLETIHRNMARFWLHAHDQFGGGATWLLFALALTGLAWLWRNRRADAVALFFFGAGDFGGVVFGTPSRAGYEWTQDNFFTPVYLALSLLAGAGIAALLRRLPGLPVPRFAATAFGAACLGLALVPLNLNYSVNDQSAYTGSYDEGINMLKTVQRNGVILCNGDIDILPLWYLQLAEGKRPDVASLTTQMVALQWYRDDIARKWPYLQTSLQGDASPVKPEETGKMTMQAVEEMIHSQGANHAFYVTNIYPQGSAFLWQDHPLVPDGLLWRFADTQGQAFAFNSGRVNDLWSRYQLRDLQPSEHKYWDDYTDVMKDAYGQACSWTGEFAMAAHSPELAQWSYAKALQYHQPQILGETYLRLADAELALGKAAQAINDYQNSLQREPRLPNRPYFYSPYAYARLGDAFLMERDYLNAQEAYRAALGINPQQKEALEGMQRLNQAQGQS